MTSSSFIVLAISQSDYKEQVNLSSSYANFMEDDTDYTILISSKHFKKFIKEETDSPLSIMVSVALNEDLLQINEDSLQINEDSLQINEDLLQINEDLLQINEDLLQINEDSLQINEDSLQINNNLPQIVCGSIGILDDNVLGDDYIVMPNEYFKKLQIESFTSVKIEKVINIKKINYIKIRGHDKKYTSWDGINEILEAHLNKFRAISSGQTTNVLGINFTIIEMKDYGGNIIIHGSLYETDVNIEFDDLEPRVPVKTTEEILKDNERTYVDDNGNTITYDVDNIVENVKHKYRNWRLTF